VGTNNQIPKFEGGTNTKNMGIFWYLEQLMSRGRAVSAEEWNLFALEDKPTKQAFCLLCSHTVKADSNGVISSSSMSKHLDSHKLSSSFRDTALPGSRNFVETRTAFDSSSGAAAPSAKKQSIISVAPAVSAASISAHLLDVILMGALPFNFVASPAVATLIHAFQPSYKVPGPATMARHAKERYAAVMAEERALFMVHGSRGSSLSVRAWCCCKRLLLFRLLFSICLVTVRSLDRLDESHALHHGVCKPC
jgi:hypothetical protein